MIRKIGAAGALGMAVLAVLGAVAQAAPQENKSAKPAPEDIPPVRMIADPYPAFNGIAVDAANGLVAMSDPNRKSLLLYARAGGTKRGASQGDASVPIRQIVGPDTFLGMIAGIILDPQHQEIYTANNNIEDTVVVMPYA